LKIVIVIFFVNQGDKNGVTRTGNEYFVNAE